MHTLIMWGTHTTVVTKEVFERIGTHGRRVGNNIRYTDGLRDLVYYLCLYFRR